MKYFSLIFLFILALSCKNNSESNGAEDAATAQVEHSEEMKESISRGAKVYSNFCASCHLSNGEGIEGVFPPLKGSDWLTEKRKETIHAVKYGISGPIEVNGKEYDNLMPSLGLTDEEVADVMNYINNSWGNGVKKPVTVEEVASITK